MYATANAIASFENRDAEPGQTQFTSRCEASDAGAEHEDVRAIHLEKLFGLQRGYLRLRFRLAFDSARHFTHLQPIGLMMSSKYSLP